jgi:hypothetical protein
MKPSFTAKFPPFYQKALENREEKVAPSSSSEFQSSDKDTTEIEPFPVGNRVIIPFANG